MPILRSHPYVSGVTVYATLQRLGDQAIWRTDTSAFVTFDDAGVANYDIAMPASGEQTHVYTFTMPSGVAAGQYEIRVYEQAGGSPAPLTDTPLVQWLVAWGGSAEATTPAGAEGWTRFALTGDPDAAAPTDGQLTTALLSATRTCERRWPCTASLTDADELEMKAQAVGYLAAAAYIRTPAGAAYLSSFLPTETRIGPVTRKQGGAAKDVSELARQWEAEARQVAGGIACVAAAQGAASVFALSPTARREQETLVEAAFGDDEDDDA